MAVWDNSTKWRQGHFLSADAISGARIGEDTDCVVLVISHDCDLAQGPDVEPSVEAIVGRRLDRIDGNYTHAKNVRRLHLTASSGLMVELTATQKVHIPKSTLSEYDPDPAHALSPNELVILQRWLSARYFRSAFADEFNNRLRRTGIEAALRKVASKHGNHIRGIFLDVDDGREVERSGEDDPYTLNVVLVYDTDHDALAAEREANDARQAIENAFNQNCRSGWVWKEIELQSCEVMSDHAITFRQSLALKEWRSEHVSLKNMQPSMSVNRDAQK